MTLAQRNSRIRQLARAEWAPAARYSGDGQLEIDKEALVSEGSDNGAYVQAWVWVSFEGTKLDKEKKK